MTTEAETTKPETIEIEDLNTFVKILTDWHNRKVAVLKHMLTIPAGTEMESGGKSATLEGDLHTGFIAGLEVALSELGTLPFAFETEEAAPSNG